jgi:hypothetical protein
MSHIERAKILILILGLSLVAGTAEAQTVKTRGFVPAEPAHPAAAPNRDDGGDAPAHITPTSDRGHAKPSPETHPPEKTRECAKNSAEWKRSPMLQKALGAKYNPFTTWVSKEGAEIVPVKSGGMYVKVPMLGKLMGYKDTPLPVEICVDAAKPHRLYLVRFGKRMDFDDAGANRITLGDAKNSATFYRAGGEAVK